MEPDSEPPSPLIIPHFYQKFLDRNGIASPFLRAFFALVFLLVVFLCILVGVTIVLGKISQNWRAASLPITVVFLFGAILRNFLWSVVEAVFPPLWDTCKAINEYMWQDYDLFEGSPALRAAITATLLPACVAAVVGALYSATQVKETGGGTAAGREWLESAQSAESAMNKVKAGNLGDITPTEARNFERQKGLSIGESLEAARNVREIYGK